MHRLHHQGADNLPIKHLFSIDPGDSHNGFCYFKYDPEAKKADLKIMEVLSPPQLSGMLKMVWGISQTKQGDEKPDITFVTENFRVDEKVRGAIFQWNEMKTSRAIGKIELVAEWTESKLIIQEPSILGMARKWAPFPLPKGHIPDDKSAFLHGAHYMQKVGWIMTVDQIIMFGQEKL